MDGRMAGDTLDTHDAAPSDDTPPPPRAPIPSIGRKEVARALGVSISTVRRLERTELHPWRDAEDVVRFDLREVEAHRLRREQPATPRNPRAATGRAATGELPPGSSAEPEPEPSRPDIAGDRGVAAMPARSTPPSTPVAFSGDADGEIAARCFPLFNAGKRPREVVIVLKMSPPTVLKKFEEWLALGGMVALPHSARAAVATVAGRYPTDANVVQVIDALVAEVAERRGFRYPCSVCAGPIIAEPDEEWRAVVDSGALARYRHSECAGREAGIPPR